MKFLFAKHTIICKACPAEIMRGELYLRTFIKTETYRASFNYHYECYIAEMAERIRKRALYWMDKQRPPKKMGRPPKTSMPIKYRKLKALQRYHQKAGHPEDVARIEVRIRRIIDATI